MTALVVVMMFVGFVILDVVVRRVNLRMQERRAQRERETVLMTSLTLDVSHEAKSLKRVEVPHAKARVLAVDDEPVVLDSFRKVLVLDGWSVDTVETGPEALGLVQRNDYDFLFTDLKMPGMDGVEVVKGVRHLRPDMDVAVITGYATIESAVETMRYGAVDYVQKPFTSEELIQFARHLLIKRQARLEAHRRPSVNLVAPSVADASRSDEYCIPGGVFVCDGHAWGRIETSGLVRSGLDDFGRKALGSFDRVELPARGVALRRGDTLFTLRRGDRAVHIPVPFSGTVSQVNAALVDEPALLAKFPYDQGWVCLLQPSNLAAELPFLRIGRPVVDWYEKEIARLRQAGGPAAGGAPQVDWATLEENFFGRAARAA
jgi:CheY-like chemotaxis protein/glycine cleavage system H lipoate-binding protein